MNYKKFTSTNNWFTISLPEDWDNYDDGSKDTYAFVNSKSNEWKGNLRITPFRWNNTNTNLDKAAEFIQSEFHENDSAIKTRLNSFDCTHYKKDLVQNNEAFVIYYWATGSRNNLFICSFTIAKDQENTEQNKYELEIVENILESIELI